MSNKGGESWWIDLHGTCELEQQSAAIGLPIKTISSSWQDYENNFVEALETLKKEHSISYAVFGDIDLQPHRDWEEKVCNKVGIEAVLPLWQQDRKMLVTEMLHAGIETIIVSCNETMGEHFLGKTLTPAVIEEIESIGVDACGENGEFHTLVLNCPLFSKRIDVSVIEKVKHENYWFVVMK